MQTIQENMKTMRGMVGSMMMGGESKQRPETLEKRLDMTQMMMEQMIQHDQMMGSISVKWPNSREL